MRTASVVLIDAGEVVVTVLTPLSDNGDGSATLGEVMSAALLRSGVAQEESAGETASAEPSEETAETPGEAGESATEEGESNKPENPS